MHEWKCAGMQLHLSFLSSYGMQKAMHKPALWLIYGDIQPSYAITDIVSWQLYNLRIITMRHEIASLHAVLGT